MLTATSNPNFAWESLNLTYSEAISLLNPRCPWTAEQYDVWLDMYRQSCLELQAHSFLLGILTLKLIWESFKLDITIPLHSTPQEAQELQPGFLPAGSIYLPYLGPWKANCFATGLGLCISSHSIQQQCLYHIELCLSNWLP